MGILCDSDDFVSVYQWASHHLEWLQFVGLCLNKVSSHDTMNRLFRLLDPKQFQNCFAEWVRTIAETVKSVIAIDGKTLCNSGDDLRKISPLHIVHAFATENELLLGQLATDAKSNEITAIPELLKMLTIEGNIITIDAMGCQKEIVQQITSQGGDYVIALKGNQSKLHDEAENFFLQAMDFGLHESGCDLAESVEKNRGRIEERQVWVCSVDWLEESMLQKWSKLRSLICIKSRRTRKGKTTEELRYYISSLLPEAELHKKVVRAHWGVENKLHWHLDVSFKEDLCKVRSNHAAENFSLVRKMSLNLLKADTSEKLGVPNKRKLCGWSSEYLLKILGVK